MQNAGNSSDVNEQHVINFFFFLQEAEAYTLYNKALDLLRNGNASDAEVVFRDLIDHDFLVEVLHYIV